VTRRDEAVYEASPECERRRCVVSFEYLPTQPVVAIQHGPNPEAVLLLDGFYQGTAIEASANARNLFRVFAERCHRHEDGDVLDEWVDSIDRDGHRTRCQELPS
jgi:hypothetical protein